jgi:hypothetical protein
VPRIGIAALLTGIKPRSQKAHRYSNHWYQSGAEDGRKKNPDQLRPRFVGYCAIANIKIIARVMDITENSTTASLCSNSFLLVAR